MRGVQHHACGRVPSRKDKSITAIRPNKWNETLRLSIAALRSIAIATAARYTQLMFGSRRRQVPAAATPATRIANRVLGVVFALVQACGLATAAVACHDKGSEPKHPLADVTANEHGFSPPSLSLGQGAPGSHATVTFVRTSDKTCATEVVFPDLKIEKKLPLDEVVSVDVPTDSARTLTFQCGMAMYKGKLVVAPK
jgi:hypothetical protein